MITLILVTAGKIMLNLIIICILAIPTGFGLGMGFYWSKRAISKLWSKKQVEKDHKELINDEVFVKPQAEGSPA